MSVAGLCSICERREATQSCGQCGNVVCDVHFDRDRNLCSACASGTRFEG